MILPKLLNNNNTQGKLQGSSKIDATQNTHHNENVKWQLNEKLKKASNQPQIVFLGNCAEELPCKERNNTIHTSPHVGKGNNKKLCMASIIKHKFNSWSLEGWFIQKRVSFNCKNVSNKSDTKTIAKQPAKQSIIQFSTQTDFTLQAYRTSKIYGN